jgi:hypothetical protein
VAPHLRPLCSPAHLTVQVLWLLVVSSAQFPHRPPPSAHTALRLYAGSRLSTCGPRGDERRQRPAGRGAWQTHHVRFGRVTWSASGCSPLGGQLSTSLSGLPRPHSLTRWLGAGGVNQAAAAAVSAAATALDGSRGPRGSHHGSHGSHDGSHGHPERGTHPRHERGPRENRGERGGRGGSRGEVRPTRPPPAA